MVHDNTPSIIWQNAHASFSIQPAPYMVQFNLFKHDAATTQDMRDFMAQHVPTITQLDHRHYCYYDDIYMFFYRHNILLCSSNVKHDNNILYHNSLAQYGGVMATHGGFCQLLLHGQKTYDIIHSLIPYLPSLNVGMAIATHIHHIPCNILHTHDNTYQLYIPASYKISLKNTIHTILTSRHS